MTLERQRPTGVLSHARPGGGEADQLPIAVRKACDTNQGVDLRKATSTLVRPRQELQQRRFLTLAKTRRRVKEKPPPWHGVPLAMGER